MSYEGEPVHSKNPCNSGYYFASVIGFGEVVFIEPVDEKSEALSVMYKHQAGKYVTFTAEQIKGVCVFKIVSKDFIGKKKTRSNA